MAVFFLRTFAHISYIASLTLIWDTCHLVLSLKKKKTYKNVQKRNTRKEVLTQSASDLNPWLSNFQTSLQSAHASLQSS